MCVYDNGNMKIWSECVAYMPGASCMRHSGESFNNYDNTNDIVGPVETSPILTTGSEDVIERGVRLRADSAKGALQTTAFQAVVADFVMPMLAALATTDDCHGTASRTPTETAKVIDVFGHRDLWLDQ